MGEAQRERVRAETEEDRSGASRNTRQIEQATQSGTRQIRDESASSACFAAEDHPQDADRDDQQRLIDEALAEIDFSELEGSRS